MLLYQRYGWTQSTASNFAHVYAELRSTRRIFVIDMAHHTISICQKENLLNDELIKRPQETFCRET